MFLNKYEIWIRGLLKKAFLSKDKLFLYFFIIIVPFAVYPFKIMVSPQYEWVIHQRKIREVCLYSFAIIICSFLQKSKWLSYFIIWCVINWWLNFFLPKESYIFLTNILSALIIYIGIGKLLKNGILKRDIIMRIICIMIFFQCIWLIMQRFNFDPVFYPITSSGDPLVSRIPMFGWSGNPALLGVFFASTSFLLLEYFKIKNIPVLFFAIWAGLFLFLRSATTIIAFSMGGIFYLLNRYSFKKKYILIGIGLLFVIAYLIYIKCPNFDRLYIWKKLVFSGIKVRPFVGSGLGVFSHLLIIDKTGTPWFEAHNDYLQMILELGIIGFILFLGFIISRFVMFFKSKRSNKQICIMSNLVAYLVSGFSLFPMHITQLSFYAIIFLSVLEHSYDEPKILQY